MTIENCNSGVETDDSRQFSRDSPWREKGNLEELYQKQELSLRETGDKLGCNEKTVRRWMKRHGIETRERRDAMAKTKRGWPASFKTTEEGYEKWHDQSHGRNERVAVHRLLAVAEFGFDAVCDKAVHHGRGGGHLPACEIPWANWGGNLELLRNDEHGAHHNPLTFNWIEVLKVREFYRNGDVTHAELARIFGCHPRVIRAVINKERAYGEGGERRTPAELEACERGEGCDR